MDPRPTAVARYRIRIRSIATVHAVATVKIDRGPQCKNTKPGCNRKTQSQTRAVNGLAALVTTPLRSLVTRAPSDQASQAPGIRLSLGLRLQVDTVIRAHIPDHWGPQVPLDAAPPLAREFEARVCRSGRTWGLSGQLWIIGSIRIVSIDIESARPCFMNSADKQENYLTKSQTENEGYQFILGGQECTLVSANKGKSHVRHCLAMNPCDRFSPPSLQH